MTPAAAVVHQPPTRTRLRIPSRRCAFLRLDRAAPGRKPGIHWARTNAATGSIVIEHAGEFGTIASDAARDGLFELQRPPSGAAGSGDDVPPSEASTFPASCRSALWDWRLSAGSGPHHGKRGREFPEYPRLVRNARQTLAHGTLVGCGLYQLLNGELLGSAASLLFYAASANYMAETKRPEEVP
jgi:hypothetical protein